MSVTSVVITKEQADNCEAIQSLYNIGMCLFTYSGADGSTFKEFMDALPDFLKSYFPTSTSKIVVVSEELKNSLTDDELYAMLKHEEGHFTLNHLDNCSAGVLCSETIEIEADNYALQYVSANTLEAGLFKAVAFFVSRILLSMGLEDEKDVYDELIAECHVVQSERLANLRKFK